MANTSTSTREEKGLGSSPSGSTLLPSKSDALLFMIDIRFWSRSSIVFRSEPVFDPTPQANHRFVRGWYPIDVVHNSYGRSARLAPRVEHSWPTALLPP